MIFSHLFFDTEWFLFYWGCSERNPCFTYLLTQNFKFKHMVIIYDKICPCSQKDQNHIPFNITIKINKILKCPLVVQIGISKFWKKNKVWLMMSNFIPKSFYQLEAKWNKPLKIAYNELQINSQDPNKHHWRSQV